MISEHIEITPSIYGGKPSIAGHRIRVEDVGMLDNPENKVWLDVDTIVATRDSQAAIRPCRELAEYNELRGEGRCTFCGVIMNKSGRSYRCIFEREIEQ